MSKVIGIDVGGTFADFVYFDEKLRGCRVAKVSSTSSNQADGIFAGVEALQVALGSVGAVVHGTTVAINALLERKSARLGLMANREDGSQCVAYLFHGGAHGANAETDGLIHGSPTINISRIRPTQVLERRYGIASERELADVGSDFRPGFISPRTAREFYQVSLTDEGAVDVGATTRLRCQANG